MTYTSPYEAKVAAAIAEINQLFAEKLDLEIDMYQGDMSTGYTYGYIFPRDLVPPKQKAYQGIGKYIWKLDILCQFSITAETNMQQAAAQYILKVNNVISQINAVKSTGNKTGSLEPGKISAVPSQLSQEPYDALISIVGSATLEQYIYHDGCGTPVFDIC